MNIPFTSDPPTVHEKLWELFWAVNAYNDVDDPNEPSKVRSAWGKVDEVMEWLSNWLHENSASAEDLEDYKSMLFCQKCGHDVHPDQCVNVKPSPCEGVEP